MQLYTQRLLEFPDIRPDSVRSGDFVSRSRSRSGDFYGIRPYQSGDDISRVDWKKSLTTWDMLQIREYETDTDQALVCIVYDDPTLLFGTADQSAGIYSIVEMIDILVRSSWPRHMSGALYLISPDSTIIQIPLPRSEHALAQCKKYLLDRAYETITKDVPIRTNGYIGDLRESMVYVFRGTNTVDITPLLIDSSRIVEIEMAYPSHFIQREGLEISTLSGSRILDDEGVVSSKIQRLSPFHTRSRYVLGGDTYEFLQRTLHPWILSK